MDYRMGIKAVARPLLELKETLQARVDPRFNDESTALGGASR